jgi:hypothetical protein
MKRSSDTNSLYVDQPTKKLCFGQSSEDEVIVTHITSDEKRTKKMCLGESSEDEVTITRITSTPAHNESEDNGPTILQNTEDIITHLPEKLLERIMLKLGYNEFSNVRRVCRRFRETVDGILDRQVRSLKGCVERLLADLVKEENALLAKTSAPTYRRTDSRCRGTLDGIHSEIRLLRAVSCRLLSLGSMLSNSRYSDISFVGYTIYEVHHILRIMRTRRLPTEGLDLAILHTWILRSELLS